jgi:ankyrin repeat protein
MSTKILFNCDNDTCTEDDEYRNTPVTNAAWYGNMAVVRVLLESGGNVERSNGFRNTALHLAALKGHLEVCRLLLDWGAKVDPLNVWQYTPLHYAAWRGHLSVVKLLVERGADVSRKGTNGKTARDLASSYNKKDVVYWLTSASRG